ncbi:hypothetical protein yrohd0001_12980 [Yersinia rohdei ATCC 43380]|nr:hypothetical protein yrohd0001_12980 [Yersinia rohdei ATCC 43380]
MGRSGQSASLCNCPDGHEIATENVSFSFTSVVIPSPI